MLRSYSLSDEQVLDKARSAQNAEGFTGLWDGQWQGAYGSQSEADLALCCSLAFWTGKDPAQMDRLFRQSKLFREKWDMVHHADGATYGAETIKQSLERTEETYSPEGEPAILERNGRYYRNKGDSVYPLTNFIIRPLEMLISDEETHMTCVVIPPGISKQDGHVPKQLPALAFPVILDPFAAASQGLNISLNCSRRYIATFSQLQRGDARFLANLAEYFERKHDGIAKRRALTFACMSRNKKVLQAILHSFESVIAFKRFLQFLRRFWFS